MGMHHLQTEVFRSDFSRHLPSLLAIISWQPIACGRAFFSLQILRLLRLVFSELHATLVLVDEFNLARPG
jgi:hypothetical protein